MDKNILITGSNGQLGSELRIMLHSISDKVIFTDIETLNITDINSVRNFIMKNNVGQIVNCAAYTFVDKAEDEINTADLVNHIAVNNLALVAKEFLIRLIHISTDYVFSGSSNLPYTEDNVTSPVSVYGKTKLLGERSITEKKLEYIILRTSWLYSSYGTNFVKTILNLSQTKSELMVIADQVGSPTFARDLASIISIMLNTKKWESGVYHFSNEGICSWYDFARAIIDISGSKCKIIPCRTNQYPTKALRPIYSVFDKSKIKIKYNIEIPYWRDSLEECLAQIIEIKHINTNGNSVIP